MLEVPVPAKTKPHERLITVMYYPYNLLEPPIKLTFFVDTLSKTVKDLQGLI
jgi:hypothetical protein